MSSETSSINTRFAPQAQPAGSAMTRNAEASGEYIIKLAEAQAVLAQAAAQFAGEDGGPAKVTQASSLGAEDVVISYLINSLKLDIGIFVLETGALHQETLDLLGRFKASSRAPVTIYTPVAESVVQFVAREGKDAHDHIAAGHGLDDADVGIGENLEGEGERRGDIVPGVWACLGAAGGYRHGESPFELAR